MYMYNEKDFIKCGPVIFDLSCTSSASLLSHYAVVSFYLNRLWNSSLSIGRVYRSIDK